MSNVSVMFQYWKLLRIRNVEWNIQGLSCRFVRKYSLKRPLYKGFLATKMVLAYLWDMDIWFSVVLICATPHNLTHYSFEKKVMKIFLKNFGNFFWNFFQKLFFGSKWTLLTIEKKIFFEKIIFLKFHHYFQMPNVWTCVVWRKLKLQKTKFSSHEYANTIFVAKKSL